MLYEVADALVWMLPTAPLPFIKVKWLYPAVEEPELDVVAPEPNSTLLPSTEALGFAVHPINTAPLEVIRIRSVPAVLAATVSAAGSHNPVSAVPVVDTMAGSAAVPAATVVMPVALSVVNAPAAGVVAPTVPLMLIEAVPANPAVRLLTATCFVVLDCTMGNTSPPVRGVLAAGNAEIFTSAMIES